MPTDLLEKLVDDEDEPEDREERDDGNPIDQTPPVPEKKAEPVKLTVASDFVEGDTDRPKADENVSGPPPPTPEPPAPPKKRKGGRPSLPEDKLTMEGRRSRERRERMQANRLPPPSFGDLPGGAPNAPANHQPPPTPGARPINYRMNADVCFGMVTGAMTMMLSDEWQPSSSAEKEQVVDTLAKYMEHKKWDDLSPGWALAVVTTFYCLPRFSMPKTKEKLTKIMKKLKREEDDNVSRL